MGHDERTHETRRDTPTRGPCEFLFVILVDEFNVERSSKILPQEVRRPALQGFAVLHESLDAICFESPGEALVRRFKALDDRQADPFSGKRGIDAEHTFGLL